MVPRPANTSPLGALHAALLWAAALLVLGSADAAVGMSTSTGGGGIRGGVRALVSDWRIDCTYMYVVVGFSGYTCISIMSELALTFELTCTCSIFRN